MMLIRPFNLLRTDHNFMRGEVRFRARVVVEDAFVEGYYHVVSAIRERIYRGSFEQ